MTPRARPLCMGEPRNQHPVSHNKESYVNSDSYLFRALIRHAFASTNEADPMEPPPLQAPTIAIISPKRQRTTSER